MEQKHPPSIPGTVPCDKCLDRFISTRHQLHQQIYRWQQDYMQMKAENERLRARNAELVDQEIRLRLDRQDAAPQPQHVTDPLGRPRTITLGQKLRSAISAQNHTALRLADLLDAHQFDEPHAAAAELRRLHGDNERLRGIVPEQGGAAS